MAQLTRPDAAGTGTGTVAGRVLVAKLGLDGHDVGAKTVARLLRDNGYEVVYLGIRQTPEVVVRAAIDEDVDLIGLSMLSGAHGPLVKRVFDLLGDGEHPPVVLGGVIPADDHDELAALGVRSIFSAGTPVAEMLNRIRALIAEYRGAA